MPQGQIPDHGGEAMISWQSRAARVICAVASLFSFAIESGAGRRCGSLTANWSF
jgi:hypothetical protein